MSPSWARQRAKRFGAFITSPHPKWSWCFTLPGGKNQERNWVVQSSQASKFQMAHGFPLFYGNGKGIDNIGAPWKFEYLQICLWRTYTTQPREMPRDLVLSLHPTHGAETLQGCWECQMRSYSRRWWRAWQKFTKRALSECLQISSNIQ